MTMKTLRVSGARTSHPIYVPPKVEQDWNEQALIPASVLRNIGWPEEAIPQAALDVDDSYAQCIAERGATTCPCGAFALEWLE